MVGGTSDNNIVFHIISRIRVVIIIIIIIIIIFINHW
jgi:hypothetical protein